MTNQKKQKRKFYTLVHDNGTDIFSLEGGGGT